MTIQSMTGFGKKEVSDDNYTVTVEIKSVNHRFKDTRFRMPSSFSSIEHEMSKAIGATFKRGSFDIYVSYKKKDKLGKFNDLDEAKVKGFVELVSKMVGEENLSIRPTDFLRNEFMQDQDGEEVEPLLNLTKKGLDGAIEELKKARVSEGGKLVKVLQKHRDIYLEHFKKIEGQVGDYRSDVEEKLRKKLSEYSKEFKLDEPRFLQEVVYYLEKLDVHEEINRIHAHLEKLDKLMTSEHEIGRQLDFLVQELNRETNTIGSKSGRESISGEVVQMKVQLEKIREQALNLE